MFPEKIAYSIQGGTDIEFPRMVRVRQNYDTAKIDDIAGTVERQIRALSLPDLHGKRIAITAGSRGIHGIAVVTRAIVDTLRDRGAVPFVFPAMGSHGGGEAESQKEYLAGYGITEASMGCPILSSMDTVVVGSLESGEQVHCDRLAWEADGIVVCNRVKPHPNFKGEVESGLCKMAAIGMGKHAGAASMHRLGFDLMADTLQEAAGVLLRSGKILFGLGLVENAYDRLLRIEALPPGEIIAGDKRLLREAKKSIARFLLPKIDVLVVDRIGKNISGSGMDPNVTGRPLSGLPGFDTIPIRKIVVLDLTPETMGNSTGLGAADVTTTKLVRKINFNYVYTNAMTSMELMAGKLPVFVNSDREAIAVGMICCPRTTPQTSLVVRIRDTLSLDEIEVSENYLPMLCGREDITILSEPRTMRFDADGNIMDFDITT